MYEVVGYRKCSGKSKATGKEYSGYFVHFVTTQEGVTGKAVENTFISDSLGYEPVLGDVVRLNYNSRAFLTEVEVVR